LQNIVAKAVPHVILLPHVISRVERCGARHTSLRERYRERNTKREIQRERDRERDTQREIKRERYKERDTKRERQRERDKERDTKRETQRERYRERYKERDKKNDTERENHRQRDKELESECVWVCVREIVHILTYDDRYRVAKIHRMPQIAGLFPQNSH